MGLKASRQGEGLFYMRRLNIRALRANLASELGDLPFVVTRNGVEVAMVTSVHGVHELEPIVKKDVVKNVKPDNACIPSNWKEEFFRPSPKKGK